LWINYLADFALVVVVIAVVAIVVLVCKTAFFFVFCYLEKVCRVTLIKSTRSFKY